MKMQRGCGCGAATVRVRRGRIETLQKPLKNCLGATKRYKIQCEPKRYEMVRKPLKMQRGCGCGAATVRVRCGRIETLQKPMKNCLGATKRYKIQCKITWVIRDLLLSCLCAPGFNYSVFPRGLEPRTLRLLVVRSNQLANEPCG